MRTSTIKFNTSISTAKIIASLALLSLFACSAGYAQNRAREYSAQPNANTASAPARRVLVRSTALLVRAAVVEEKLLKRPEFSQLGLAITRDEADADIILELRHDLLTKYVFTIVDTRTQTVLAGGKVSSLGGTVAGKVAKRFVKEMARTRTP